MTYMIKPGIYLSKVKDKDEVLFLSFRLWLNTYGPTLSNLHVGAVQKEGKWVNVNWTPNPKTTPTFIDMCGRYLDGNDKNTEKFLNVEHELLWDFTCGGPGSRLSKMPDDPILAKSYLYLFYTTTFNFFSEFIAADPDKKKQYFKGRAFAGQTFGTKVESYPGLIMKAIKTGFSALGVEQSSGFKLDDFRYNDIAPYVKKMYQSSELNSGTFNWGNKCSAKWLCSYNAKKIASLFIKSVKVQPEKEAEGYMEPALYNDEISKKFEAITKLNPGYDAIKKAGNEAVVYPGARNDHLIRVTAYGFRGDTRPPVQIKADGGFHPNATRDDRRRIAELPLEHPDRPIVKKLPKGTPKTSNPVTTEDFLDNLVHQASWGSDYSGFVSFAKNPAKAIPFISISFGFQDKTSGFGWLYVVKCRDALDVAASFKNPRYYENELSVAGGVEWDDVVAWRKVKWSKSGGSDWADSTIYLSDNERKLPKVPTSIDSENKYNVIHEVLSASMTTLTEAKDILKKEEELFKSKMTPERQDSGIDILNE